MKSIATAILAEPPVPFFKMTSVNVMPGRAPMHAEDHCSKLSEPSTYVSGIEEQPNISLKLSAAAEALPALSWPCSAGAFAQRMADSPAA